MCAACMSASVESTFPWKSKDGASNVDSKSNKYLILNHRFTPARLTIVPEDCVSLRNQCSFDADVSSLQPLLHLFEALNLGAKHDFTIPTSCPFVGTCVSS